MAEESWADLTHVLVDVAMGRIAADVVVKDGRWVCVQSGEILEHTDIAIKGSRIAYVGSDASHTIAEDTKIIEADGHYLVPGLLDGHMHVESSMLTITEFARTVLPHGTTGIFIDPHEIANVLGIAGVRMMVNEAALQPIHVWVQMPSCVPSAPGFETPGASIGPQEVSQAMRWPGVIGLGEVMNFPGVIEGDAKMHAEIAETRRAGKVVGGHYASPDLGLPFHGYVAGGAEDDHEGTRLEDAVARVRQGMKAMLRYGSGWRDVAAQLPAVTQLGLEARHFLLVTDDIHSATLVQEGHMDRVLRHAMEQGAPPMTAIQMATLNTAQHFGLARHIGQIAPGRFADILLVKDLKRFAVDRVLVKGVLAAGEGKLLIEAPSFVYPEEAVASIRLPRPLKAQDFVVRSERKGPLTANVIGVVENQAPTKHLRLPMQAVRGMVGCDLERDIAKVAVVERHTGAGGLSVGFVQGFGFRAPCAIASTVAHDSHNLLIVGTDEENMARAGNALSEVGGGQCVVKEGEVVAMVELPIAGLMSAERAEVVARKAERMLEGYALCGCTMSNPNMQLSLLALVVIPALRISDKGLVDVNRFAFIPLLQDAE
jgi:adenine deaminase